MARFEMKYWNELALPRDVKEVSWLARKFENRSKKGYSQTKHCFHLLIKYKILRALQDWQSARKQLAEFVYAGSGSNCLEFFHWRVSAIKYFRKCIQANDSSITKVFTWTGLYRRRRRNYIEIDISSLESAWT